MEQDFTYEASEQMLVIHLPREVDHHNCTALKNETDLILAENYVTRMIFDFTDTQFMDSSGIGVLLNRYKQMRGSRTDKQKRPDRKRLDRKRRRKAWNRILHMRRRNRCW